MTKEKKEWRFTYYQGRTYAEVRYVGGNWCNWLFPFSNAEKKNYNYVPELGVYVRNTSIG